MCNDCNEVFLTVSLLEKHQNVKHLKSGAIRYQCNFCRKVFLTAEEHNRHTVLEHNQFIIDQVDKQKHHNFFKCSRCAQTFPVVKDLTEHIVVKHAEENTGRRVKANTEPNMELKCRCTLCLRNLLVRTELEPHYREFHPGQSCDSYMCGLCNKIFRSVDFLERHEKIHRDSKPFQCGGCQAKFTLASTLHNHVKNCQSIPLNAMNRILLPTKVMEKEKKVFLCSTCKTEFPSNSAVKQHNKSSNCGTKKAKAVLRPIYPKIP